MQVIKKHLKDVNTVLFLLSYGIFAVINLLTLSFYGKYIPAKAIDVLWNISLVLLLIKEFINPPKTSKEYIVGLICFALFLFTKGERHFGVTTESVFFILIFCSRNIGNEKIVRFIKWFSIACLAFVTASSQAGIIQDFVETGKRTRHYLGFLYSLYPSAVMLHITFLFFISDKKTNKKQSIITYAVLLLANIWFYHMTSSRLSFIIGCAACLIGVYCLYTEFPFNFKIIQFLCIGSFLILTLFSIHMAFSFDSSKPEYLRLNDILSDRLRLSQNSIDKYWFRLYERDIEWHGQGIDYDGLNNTEPEQYDYVDCAYIRDLQKYGIMFYSIVMILVLLILNETRKRGDIRSLILFAMFSVQLLIDDLSLLIQFSSLILLLGAMGVKYYLGDENS